MLQALSFPLHLAAICLVTLAVLQLSSGSHRKKAIDITTDLICQRERRSIQVSYPGCQPTTTKVPVCAGQCRSYSIITNANVHPLTVSECSVCSTVGYRIKKHRQEFTCNGSRTNKTIFLPIVTECACARERHYLPIPRTPPGKA